MKTSSIGQAKVEIEHAASEAVRVIAHAAEEAAKVVANAAAESVKISNIKNTDGTTDHDVLNTLVANVAFLKESQEKFHQEMKDSFKDLKDNYSSQINNHEIRLTALELSKTRQNVMMSIGIGILTLLVSLLTYHLTQR
jgi:alanyl-tRNA synthetase